MFRAILIAMSLLLAAADYMSQTQVFLHTQAVRVAYSLGYAFMPAAIGLLVAGIKRLLAKWRNWPDTFARDLNWVWGVLLAVLVVKTLLRSLPY